MGTKCVDVDECRDECASRSQAGFQSKSDAFKFKLSTNLFDLFRLNHSCPELDHLSTKSYRLPSPTIENRFSDSAMLAMSVH